jgi:ribosome-binding factor A
MPREFLRFQRVSRQLQRELGEILQRDLRDPDVGFVTVNDVEVTKDLALAKVYIGVLTTKDDENKQSSIVALNRA